MPPDDAGTLLELASLSKSFGGIKALDCCSFQVPRNTLFGVIGPNGAGKSVTFNLISGLMRPDGGDIYFESERITGLPPDRIVARGIGRTLQDVRVFPQLSVLEHILLAQQHKGLFGNVGALFHLRPTNMAARESRLDAERILEEVNLLRLRNEPAGSLSFGQRKLLQFVTIMSLKPKLVLLDEPVAGLNPVMVNRIIEAVQTWHARGVTFVIVEHNMKVIMSICHHIVVLSEGRVIAEGTPEHVQNQARVMEAYFGAAA